MHGWWQRTWGMWGPVLRWRLWRLASGILREVVGGRSRVGEAAADLVVGGAGADGHDIGCQVLHPRGAA